MSRSPTLRYDLPSVKKSPTQKILLLDIETSPLISYTWGLYEQNVIKRIQTFSILTCAYKWLGGKTKVLSNLPTYPTDDLQLCRDLHKLLNEAEIVVAHNGASFDIKKINTRFIIHKMPPPSSYKIVDTKIVAKHVACFDSNSLNNLGLDMDEGEKIKHRGFEMWEGCLRGNLRDWKDMKKYNIQDVELLEKIYLRLRPWMTSHPHTSMEPGRCPKCGSSSLIAQGTKRTISATLQRYQCRSCGGWSSERVIGVRPNLMRNS